MKHSVKQECTMIPMVLFKIRSNAPFIKTFILPAKKVFSRSAALMQLGVWMDKAVLPLYSISSTSKARPLRNIDSIVLVDPSVAEIWQC